MIAAGMCLLILVQRESAVWKTGEFASLVAVKIRASSERESRRQVAIVSIGEGRSMVKVFVSRGLTFGVVADVQMRR